MNGDYPYDNPRAELEARVTAFILGELPAHEAAALRQAMDDDVELAALFERLRAATKLVREAAASQAEETKQQPVPMRLSEERRQKLLAHFKTVKPRQFAPARRIPISTRRLLEIAAVVAILGILAGLLLPALSKAKSKAIRVNVYNNLRQIELAKQMWADDNKTSSNDAPTISDLAENGGLPKSINGETYIIGKVGEPPVAITKDGRQISLNGEVAAAKPGQMDVAEMSLLAARERDKLSNVKQAFAEDQADANKQLKEAGKVKVPPARTTIVLPPTEDTTPIASTTRSGYVDTSAEFNPGTGRHIEDARHANIPVILGSVPTDVPPSSSVDNRLTGGNQEIGTVRRANPANGQVTVNFATGQDHTPLFRSPAQSGSPPPQIPTTPDDLGANPGSGQVDVLPSGKATAEAISPALDALSSLSVTTESGRPATLQNTQLYAQTQTSQSVTNSVAASPHGFKLQLGSASLQPGSMGAISGNNSYANSGDPDWVGFLEHPEERHAGNNLFLARGAFVALPPGQNNLDLDHIHNQASNPNSEFRFYLDENGNGTYDTGAAVTSINQVTGLPVARLAENGSLDTNFDPGPGLPLASSPAGPAGKPLLETGSFHIDSDVLHRAVDTMDTWGVAANENTETNRAPNGPGINFVTKSSHGPGMDVGKLYAAAGIDLNSNSGKALVYNERKGTLTVRGTPEDLDRVNKVNETLQESPPNVRINAKFAEVTPEDHPARTIYRSLNQPMAAPAAPAPRQRVFKLEHADAEQMAAALSQRDGVEAKADPNTHTITVNGSESMMPQISTMVQRLDEQPGALTGQIVGSGGTQPGFNGKPWSSSAGPTGYFPGSSPTDSSQTKMTGLTTFTTSPASDYNMSAGNLTSEVRPETNQASTGDTVVFENSGRVNVNTQPPPAGLSWASLDGTTNAPVPALGEIQPMGMLKTPDKPAQTAGTNSHFSGIGALNNEVFNAVIPPTEGVSEVNRATLVQDGKLLYEAGKFDEAEAKLQQVVKEDPSNVAARQYLQLAKEKQLADATRSTGQTSASTPGWTTKMHNQFGNVGVADGSVQQESENGLRTFADRTGDTNASIAANWSLFAGDSPPAAASPPTNTTFTFSPMVSTNFLDGSGGNAKAPEPVLHAGEIDSSQATTDQLLDLYGTLTDRTVEKASNLPSSTINLRTTSDLTKDEAKKAAESILAMNGISVANMGPKTVKAVPVATEGTLASAFSTNGFVFDDQKATAKQSGESSDGERMEVVGYVNIPVTDGASVLANPLNADGSLDSSFTPTNGTLAYNVPPDAINAATDEAVRRKPSGFGGHFGRFAGMTNSADLGAPTNLGLVYPNPTTMGNVTVSVDPETKRPFFITDAETAESVSNAIIHVERNQPTLAVNDSAKIPINYAKAADISDALKALGGDNPKAESNSAYQAKLRELDALRKEQDVMALQAAQASVDRSALKTPRMEVIERADDKKAQNKTVGQRISGVLTGKVTETAKLKVERDVTDVPGVSGQPAMTGIYDPYFIQTEFEAIQSEKVLDKVIEKLKLNEVWGKERGSGAPLKMSEARALLKQNLTLSQEKNTSLIDIQVKSDSGEESAKIANTIADVYADYRKQQREAVITGEQAALKNQLTEQNKKIAKAEAELAQLEAPTPQNDAPLPKPSGPAPIPQPEVSTSDNAFSTFSLNIADVSFKLAAASLEKGQMPEPASIRSEEFINAFDYRDPEPAPGAPLGFAWERARYPFAHNRDLLRFSVKTAAAGREAGRPMNIVLLLDKSGSMERADRVRIIHEALRVLATQLGPQDKLSVVTFARVPRLWVDGISGSQAAEVADGLDSLTPEGGTNLEEAMRLAYETARRHYLAGGINRVVLLTDGAANLGNVDPQSLKQKAEAHRKEGIALDCFGVGWEGYNDNLLEVLSRNGGGRYGFLNTPEEAAGGFATQLAGALRVAASDVKVQVEFNPRRVTAYRQIGYAKHQLTKEQFRDNTVAAAQVGAAESGNGLYVIEVDPNGDGPIATVRVRYRVPGTEEFPEHEWTVPYEGGAPPLEQSSPAMRLAGSASAFSEWLAASPFAEEVTTDQLLGLMRGVPETYGADERPKKLEWMVRQAKSLTGK